MVQAILVMLLIIWAERTVIGVKTVYTNEPEEREFDNLDDAMEYADLRKTGWRGSIDDYYKWKEEE